LLFLGAGSVIHAVSDNQDFRKYGGLRPFLPLTYSVMLIASLSLVAFPFMTGFYSKDLILESAYGQYYFSSTVVYFIATIGAMFTTLYSVKVLYLTFLTNPNGPLINYKNAHEGDIFMSLPLMILAVFSIFFGFITKDMFIGLGSGFFSDNALFIHPYNEILLDTEFGVPTIFKLLPLIFTISLSVIAIVLSEYLPLILIYFKLSRVGYNIFGFFNQRLLIELFYNRFITGVVLKLGGQTTKVLDKGSIEYLGPYGLEKGLLNISKNISNLNTGVITSYALYIVVSLILYIFFNTYLNGAIIILIILTSLSLSFYNSYKISPHIFTNQALHSDIGISEIITEINTLLPQFANFINQFNNTIIGSGVNVVTDSTGNMSIDVPKSMGDEVANKISTRIGILDRLITSRSQELNDLVQKGMFLEEKLKMENSNYVSQLAEKAQEIRRLNGLYKH
jgi:NADH-ubiquinone oxidoreductase chain 5